MGDARFLTRVVLSNYKSIAKCDVALGPLMFLVGPNGAGKSNFLDALRFVADALRTSLDQAFRNRGGIADVRRRSGGHPTNFGIRLEFALPDGTSGRYAFAIGARARGLYEVQREECTLSRSGALSGVAFFRVRSGRVNSSERNPPAALADRLYLVNASGLPAFRPVFDALSTMGFYNLSPTQIGALQTPDAGTLLAREGGNLSSVLAQLEKQRPLVKERIEEYLGKIVPGVSSVEARTIGPMETLEFRQGVAGARDPWRFLAGNMSDGTLRALGVLTALFQSGNGARPHIPLVGIEEPEVALHPAAAGVLIDALREASRERQIIVTSHSPDLLNDDRLGADQILAVEARDGVTQIAPIDEVGRSALNDRLYTAGELLQLDRLTPDPEIVRRVYTRQLRLFDLEDTP
jgi:predicted ATPase